METLITKLFCSYFSSHITRVDDTIYRGVATAQASQAMAWPIFSFKVGVSEHFSGCGTSNIARVQAYQCSTSANASALYSSSCSTECIMATSFPTVSDDVPESPHQPGPDFAFPKRSFGKKTCKTFVPAPLVSEVAISPLQGINRHSVLPHLFAYV